MWCLVLKSPAGYQALQGFDFIYSYKYWVASRRNRPTWTKAACVISSAPKPFASQAKDNNVFIDVVTNWGSSLIIWLIIAGECKT